MNVLTGERYRMAPRESRALLRGEYGQLPGPVDEEVRRKVIGNDQVVSCRPADLLRPELESLREEIGDLARSEEDVLSYALFPQVARSFFERRSGKESFSAEDELPAVIAAAVLAYEREKAENAGKAAARYPSANPMIRGGTVCDEKKESNRL
jgi:oxaloacetate decarboxylase alpha subunit